MKFKLPSRGIKIKVFEKSGPTEAPIEYEKTFKDQAEIFEFLGKNPTARYDEVKKRITIFKPYQIEAEK